MSDSLVHVERQILHTAMQRPSSLPDMPLAPRHFASEQFADLWEIVLRLDQDGKPCDPVSVAEESDRIGRRHLSSLAIEIAASPDLCPSSQPGYHAGLLLTGWRDREARQIAAVLADEVGRREDGAVDRAIASLMALHDDDRQHEGTARTAVKAAWEEISAAYAAGGRIVGIPTGLADLDDSLGGLHGGDLIVIGARPAMGKTGLLLGMVSAAARSGPVGLISGEQPQSQVGMRWTAAGSGISVSRLRAGKVEEHDWAALTNGTAAYSDLPIFIMDRSGPDVAEVVRFARRWKHQHGIRALYVDYLQRMEIAGMAKSAKHERVGAIARALKNLARDLNIPVVVLAQVNRKVEDRQNQRPFMGDLSDSSEIEKEADQVMMLWRDTSNPQREFAPAEINVVKNRHGNIGTVHCLWRGASTSFVDQARGDTW